MRSTPPDSSLNQVFSTREIALAAGVPLNEVRKFVRNGEVACVRSYVPRIDAIRLVRQLRAADLFTEEGRPALVLLPDVKRRRSVSLIASGALHVGFLLGMILITSLGLLSANDTEQEIKESQPVRLVFFMRPGPGGGGGGGGLKVSLPPPRAERKAPKLASKVDSPVPPPRKDPPPKPVEPPKPIDPPKVEPPPIEPPKPEPPKVEPPKTPPPPAVQAPVSPAPADQVNKAGDPARPPSASTSPGSGTGGGVGTGAGTGLGDGRGGGIGPGEGGGTGGGPFKPGSGIEPPTLLREVKPLYTDEARRRSIVGNVVLEIVVRRDGTVGNLRVIRSLGAGLDERALEAVRQWRFSPARRQGAPVDVIVEVSVEFRLR